MRALRVVVVSAATLLVACAEETGSSSDENVGENEPEPMGEVEEPTAPSSTSSNADDPSPDGGDSPATASPATDEPCDGPGDATCPSEGMSVEGSGAPNNDDGPTAVPTDDGGLELEPTPPEDLDMGVEDAGPPDSPGDAGAPPVQGTGPVVSGLTIEPNPNNRLSCYVSWTTERPASSEVQFGVGDVQFRIASPDVATEHRFLVIGMRADTEYLIRAVSSDGEGESSAVDAFRTGSLPSEIPLPEVTLVDPARMQPGWTLTNLMVTDTEGASAVPSILLMYDEEGVPVWYHVNGDSADTRGDVAVELADNGNLVVGPAPGQAPREIDLAGNVVWEGPPSDGGAAILSHHGGKLENGNYVVLRDTAVGEIVGTEVEEYSSDNELVWNWNLLDHVTPPEGTTGDWCHGNSVTVDLDEDMVYVNCRFLGVFKARRTGDQEAVWLLGGSYQTAMPSDFTFPVAGSQFTDAHDPELHEDGTLMLYDNGGYGRTGATDMHSRVVEYALDETTMEANLVWEFPGSFDVDPWYTDDWYTPIWGDANRLENDNVLITAGARGFGGRTRYFEVTRDGVVIWEVVLPTNFGSYRASRISAPVERL